MRLNNLTELADFLRGLDNNSPSSKMGFDMDKSYENRKNSSHPCGSACCIGGWVQHRNPKTRDLELEDAVKTICPPDMSKSEIYRLCYPGGVGHQAWKATPQQAARAVEILRDTGKCDWDRAMREVAA
jgi:hypothetical protein